MVMITELPVERISVTEDLCDDVFQFPYWWVQRMRVTLAILYGLPQSHTALKTKR